VHQSATQTPDAGHPIKVCIFQDEFLFNIVAFDQDRGVNNNITYEIESIIYNGINKITQVRKSFLKEKTYFNF
jgi:hypothetical protein